MYTSNEFLPTIAGIALAVACILFLLLWSKDDPRRDKAKTGFVIGMLIILFSFLIKNPDIVTFAEENIGLTLLGMVIATLSIIKLLKK
ncbi:MAG: hypothetical protein PVF17_05050 [Ignavibacteria bacterium]|jgi:hypothetical protein